MVHIEVLWEGRRLGPLAGKFYLTGWSLGCPCDVGGKQLVLGWVLAGRKLMSWCHEG